ncbi:hypothetical protein AAC387_Pa03g1030 [Persea americana]
MQLVSIDIGFNQFSGEIPASIGGLKGPGNLLFDKNMLSSGIPESLCSCASLHENNLTNNSLSLRSDPDDLGLTIIPQFLKSVGKQAFRRDFGEFLVIEA